MAVRTRKRRQPPVSRQEVSEEVKAVVLEMLERGMRPVEIAKEAGVATRVVRACFSDIIKRRVREAQEPKEDRREAIGPGQLADLARKEASEMIVVLAAIAKNDTIDPKVRLASADKVLTWAYGKPLGIGTPKVAAVVEKAPREEKLGKKEAIMQAAQNPSTDSPLGALMAKRMGHLQ